MSENYLPLYRKYRPQTLDTLVGQDHIKHALSAAIELGKISHAYLFTGPRGTGKTSTARILAKSLNCKNGPTLHPCGKCESCIDITNSVPIDVIEIDAASNRSVEDAQNILEKIQYAPVYGKYKIYIIDEVHMLSTTAFNALLKTLEEPPENVIFILATTEVHKVLDTIKSRCQRFDFRRISTNDIVKHLRYIADNEKINITDDALYTIAKNSAGGMRDSISLLDQLSLLGATKEVTTEDVNSILGRISFETLHKLSEKIISSSINDAVEILNDIYNAGNEPLQILTNLSEYFKNLLIVKNCEKSMLPELTGLNEAQIGELLKQKDLLETQQIVFILERLTYYIKEIKFAANQYLWLEVSIIDLSNMTENTALLDLQNRVKALENGDVASQNARPQMPVTRPAPVQPAGINQQSSQTQTEKKTSDDLVKNSSSTTENEHARTTIAADTDDFTPPPMSKRATGNDIGSLWSTLLSNVKSVPTRAILNLATPAKITPEEIIITFKNEKLVTQFTATKKKDALTEAAKTMFNGADTAVHVRLPQPGDENLQPQDLKIETQEKKKITEQTEKSNQDKFEEDKTSSAKKSVKILEESAERKNIQPTVKLDKKAKERMESDQEKMVIDLFDGKYIE